MPDQLLNQLRSSLAGRYDIDRQIGAGGMATVFLARDEKHSRSVAIKTLRPEVAKTIGAERFAREIQLAAGLNHPNILALFDSGSAGDVLYYVMPYVDGETLRARIARDGALPIADVTRLLRELADALVYAHERGVVHRDLKPDNILLSGGHAVIADFGIAKAVDAALPHDPSGAPALTGTGISLGTPAYMAPEQAVGDKNIDHRADLYSLGVIAYEMIAGAHPFGARTAQGLVAAHLTEAPPPLAARRADVPLSLAALVSHLLAKEPAQRPQSAREVVQSLDGMTSTEMPSTARPRRLWSLAIAALVILAAGASYAMLSRSGPTPIRALAVLPFVNTGGNAADDYFSDGMTDELAHALMRLPKLSISGRTSTYAFKGKSLAASEIGRALKVDALIEGTVRRSGDRLRVTTELVGTADGKVLWDSVYESRSTDVFSVQDQFTRAVVMALAPALGGRVVNARSADVDRGTTDLDAYQLYLQARYYWQARGAENVIRSIGYFKQAIARDPKFARAHAGLALAYNTLPTYVPDSRDTVPALTAASAERALQLDSTLADAQVAAAVAQRAGDGRAAEAEAHFRKAIAIEPSNAYAHHSFGFFLIAQGHTDEAVREGVIATQLDPLAKSAGTALALELAFARRGPEAIAAARRVFVLDSAFTLAYETLALAEVVNGQADSALRWLEREQLFAPNAPGTREKLLLAYASTGRWADAERLRTALHLPGGDHSGGLDPAIADFILGDREPILRLFSTVDGRRKWQARYLVGCNPVLDPIRSEARFKAAMKALEVEECQPARPWKIPPRR